MHYNQLDDDFLKLLQTLANDVTFTYEDLITDKEIYSSFLMMCGPCIMPQKTYVYMSSLSESSVDNWFTVDDEALCVVLLENSLTKWNEEFDHRLGLNIGDDKDRFSVKLDLKSVKFSPTKYSTSKQDRDKKILGGQMRESEDS